MMQEEETLKTPNPGPSLWARDSAHFTFCFDEESKSLNCQFGLKLEMLLGSMAETQARCGAEVEF